MVPPLHLPHLQLLPRGECLLDVCQGRAPYWRLSRYENAFDHPDPPRNGFAACPRRRHAAPWSRTDCSSRPTCSMLLRRTILFPASSRPQGLCYRVTVRGEAHLRISSHIPDNYNFIQPHHVSTPFPKLSIARSYQQMTQDFFRDPQIGLQLRRRAGFDLEPG